MTFLTQWFLFFQFTEEKLGRTERTEYELEFQDLEKKTDLTKSYTEKIKNNTAAVIVPNPGGNSNQENICTFALTTEL